MAQRSSPSLEPAAAKDAAEGPEAPPEAEPRQNTRVTRCGRAKFGTKDAARGLPCSHSSGEARAGADVDLVDLVSDSDESDDSIVDLTGGPPIRVVHPSTPSHASRRRRRTAAKNRNDWEAEDARSYGVPHYVYVLENDSGKVYTGCTAKTTNAEIAADHARGLRASTRRLQKTGRFRVSFRVGPFRNRTAAHRFECLVKRRGSAKGSKPKAQAAALALARSLTAKMDGVELKPG